MKDVDCPYCEKAQDINHDDGYGYDESCLHEQECGECGKTFTYTTSVSFYYEAYKAPCLNGEAEHDFLPTITCPVECTKMRCSICDEERAPTEEEFKTIINKNK